MPSRRLFDAYLIADWSAASRPKQGADSIWIAVHQDGSLALLENPATRHAAERLLREVFLDAVRAGRRLLAGFDFSFGFPAGAAAALGAGGWEGVWARLRDEAADGEDNRNDRFALAARWNRAMTADAAPFWGCPTAKSSRWLSRKRPARLGFPELRLCEQRAGARSTWQLFYKGSVGSQTLLGVPRLERLRTDENLRRAVRVWPFEPGFGKPPQPGVTLAEVYPSLLWAQARRGEVKDQAQVRTLAAHFATLDRGGGLEELWGEPWEAGPAQIETARREEGWILGVR